MYHRVLIIIKKKVVDIGLLLASNETKYTND